MMNPFGTDEMAAGYARSRPAVHPRVIERARRWPGWPGRVGRALDVGCGAGLSTCPLEPLAGTAIGIDPAEAMVRLARSTAPGSRFAVARAEALPVAAGSIDLITAAGALNYADLPRFFGEADRVLSPSGVVVVYDFSQGRSFRDSPALDAWFAEFVRLYPLPLQEAAEVNPGVLLGAGSAFQLAGHEEFEIGIPLTPAFYCDYAMTETNVAAAVRRGEPAAAIRQWCAGTVHEAFAAAEREVLFRGYIAYLTRR